MNILLITTISGFLPKFLMQDVRILQDMGYTVHYASNFDTPVYECDREALERQGIVCHHIPIAKNPLAMNAHPAALRQLNQLAEREKILAVHCHNPVGGVLGRMMRRGRKDAPELYVIYTAHGFHFYRYAPIINWLAFYPLERLLAHRTDQLITINREDRERSKRFRLRKGGSVCRIPGVGLDPKRFHPDQEQRTRCRESMGVKAGEYLFLSVGELNGNKNHETIIRAFAKTDHSRAKLFICGEGGRRKRLQRLIKRLRLQGRIVLWGYRTDIERYYQSADCFLFPSVREGLGMAALEAMACGLPVIAGDNRGTREYVLDNGSLCGPKDVDAFAEAMDRMMKAPGRAAAMGGRSMEIAAGFYQDRTEKIMRGVYERMRDSVDGGG